MINMSYRYRIKGIRKIFLLIENLLFNIFWGRRLGNRIKTFGWPIISLFPGSSIHIGKGLVLVSDTYFSEPGVNHPVIIRALKKDAKIVIGDDVGISGGGICAAEEVIIGNNVLMGANAFIADTDFHPVKSISRRYND
jgi:acetyltransferase-like isoleucine patch superfamily enzyme